MNRESRIGWRVHGLITGDEDTRVCKDIPESASRYQPENFLKHLLSSAATKFFLILADASSALKLKEVE